MHLDSLAVRAIPPLSFRMPLIVTMNTILLLKKVGWPDFYVKGMMELFNVSGWPYLAEPTYSNLIKIDSNF